MLTNGYPRKNVDIVSQVEMLNKAIIISYSANTLGKGMHPTILPRTISKQSDGMAMPWFGNQSRRKKHLNSNPLFRYTPLKN